MLLHQRGQDLSFRIVVEPQGKVNKQTGKDAAEERTLSVKAYGFARFPFLSLRDIFPRPGEVFPLRGSQAVKFITKVLGAMRKLPAVLLALPLGELASPTGLD